MWLFDDLDEESLELGTHTGPFPNGPKRKKKGTTFECLVKGCFEMSASSDYV